MTKPGKVAKSGFFTVFDVFPKKGQKSGFFMISPPSSFYDLHGVWLGVSADDHFLPLFGPSRTPHFGPLKNTENDVFNGFSWSETNEDLTNLRPDNSEKHENGCF